MTSFLIAVLAFIVTAVLTMFLRPVCIEYGHVDQPGGRKSHRNPTPLCGGIAITLTVIVVGFTVTPWLEFLGIALGSSLLLVMGAIDDRRHLPATLRLGSQALAVVLGMEFIGGVYLSDLGAIFGGAPLELGGHALWFTMFASVGMINAVNMIDGLDGLAGGFSFLLLGVVLVLASGGTALNTLLLGSVMGSLAAFLVFNLRFPWQDSARVFLGDSGSLVLGFMLTWFAIEGSQGADAFIDPITAVWLFGLPLFDTVYLMGSRAIRGRSPLTADRYHLHHLIQRCGLGDSSTLYVWLFLSGLLMALGVVAQALGISELYRLIGVVALFAVYCVLVTSLWNRADRGIASRD